MKKLFIYLSIIITVIILGTFVYSCSKEETAIDINSPIPEGMMRIQLHDIKPNVNITTLKSASAVPDDQDTLYVEFRKFFATEVPDYIFKLSPIPDNYTFELPISRSGYDLVVCTYPNKMNGTKETWDMTKHLWIFEKQDVGSNTNDIKLNVELERLSSNLVVKGRDGTTMPENVKNVEIVFDAVFNNYFPKWHRSFGLYERKRVTLWPSDTGELLFNDVCMGMKDLDSLGTFVLIVCREGTYCDYFTYRHKFILDKGKTTVVDIDLTSLGVENWSKQFIWINEEEEIIIPVN